MTASKQAFISPGVTAALRNMAPKAAIGAGVGAVGGAVAGGPGHRLEGALGGATLGAGAGAGIAHFGPRMQGAASRARAAVTPAASADTTAALNELHAMRAGAPPVPAPTAALTPGEATLSRLEAMLGKAASDGYADALEAFGLEKNAFFTAGLAAAGKALAPVAARAGAVAQRAAPAVSKGLQRAGNVLSHPLTDVGMSGAALWKNATETPR